MLNEKVKYELKYLNQKINILYLKIIIGLFLSTSVYLILNIYFNVTVTTISDPKRTIIQAISFICIPLIWYIFIINGKSNYSVLLDFASTKLGRQKRNQIIGFIEGNLGYLLISFPLFYYCLYINENIYFGGIGLMLIQTT
jgi:hypothetical protein